MRQKIKNSIFFLIGLYTWFYCTVFKALNRYRGKKKVLIYTDSRGFEVTKLWNRKNPCSSYLRFLINRYECDVQLCPEKHTSLIDFIYFYELNKTKYDLVILHCGIVDFAPRPVSSFDEMFKAKNTLLKLYKLSHELSKENREFGKEYLGEKTLSFLNKDTVENFIIPKLELIDNLIYVGINRVLNDWDGMYWRKRPVNINNQLLLDNLMHESLANTIELTEWTDEQIKMFTTDNVHYTNKGFMYIYNKILPYLEGK